MVSVHNLHADRVVVVVLRMEGQTWCKVSEQKLSHTLISESHCMPVIEQMEIHPSRKNTP